ncbi:MAG TPA: acetylglutamate kinase [Myxococcota bacterium]
MSAATSSAAPAPLALIKVGGDVVDDPAQLKGLADNLVALRLAGHRVVVVHGGGPQVTALQAALGQTAHKVAGQRVTSSDDLFAVTACLAGVVNVRLCAALTQAGVPAFGCHGANMILATKRPPLEVRGHGVVDYGEVGDVVDVDTRALFALLDAGCVPVVATLGIERANGRVLNINGDTAAVAVAVALSAQVVLLVTAVGGVFKDRHDPATRLTSLTPSQARALIADGTIVDGMIPKVEEALGLLASGARLAAIVSSKDPGAFAAVVGGHDDWGTRFVADLASST